MSDDRRAAPPPHRAETDGQLLARAAEKARRLADQLRADAAEMAGDPRADRGAPLLRAAADAAEAVARELRTDDRATP